MVPNEVVVQHEVDGARSRIVLAGELDCANTDDLATRIVAHLEGGSPDVVLDLRGVTFCGSSGLTVFIQLHNRACDQGGTLTLADPTDAVMRAIETCGLHELLTISRTVAAGP